MKYHVLKKMAEKIMYSATRIEAHTNKHIFEPFGITTSGFKILHIIHEFKDATPSQIMNMIGGTKSNITQRINYLVKQKYVKKVSENSSLLDKRKTIIRMTDYGQKKYKEIQKIVNENSFILEKLLTSTEKKHLNSLFNKIILLLDEYEKQYQTQK